MKFEKLSKEHQEFLMYCLSDYIISKFKREVDLCQYFGQKFRFFISTTIDNPNINAQGFSPEG